MASHVLIFWCIPHKLPKCASSNRGQVCRMLWGVWSSAPHSHHSLLVGFFRPQCPVRRQNIVVCSRLFSLLISLFLKLYNHCCWLTIHGRIDSLTDSLYVVVKVRSCRVSFLFRQDGLHVLFPFIPTCAGIHCSTIHCCAVTRFGDVMHLSSDKICWSRFKRLDC